MSALFIGQAYIDVTFITDHFPSGDEKHVAQDYAISFGGNAVTSGFACAKLGHKADVMCQQADDWLGKMFSQMAQRYNINILSRKVARSSLSLVLPNDGKRAIVRCRDNDYTQPFPQVDISHYKAVHVDGHMSDAAITYCRQAREKGILTSFDGGTYNREGIEELLSLIDVAVVSERFQNQLKLSTEELLQFLLNKGAKVAAVTLGNKGIKYSEGDGVHSIPAIPIPKNNIVDSTGAGDVFHGAYLYSYLQNPNQSWHQHFSFASAASAHAIQHMGNEASLPSLADVQAMLKAAA